MRQQNLPDALSPASALASLSLSLSRVDAMREKPRLMLGFSTWYSEFLQVTILEEIIYV
jgi:hypothetical protein